MQSSRYNNPAFQEDAIPFIIYDPETRKFVLTQEAVEILKNIDGPIGLVAVAGMYRTGKSYLLNRMLLNRSNGFGVGPTINPCTKGLWLWGKPVPGTTPDGEPINVLIVDTEGLGALDEDSNHDVRIFSMAILLSSFFLYNSVGSIDESALQNLSLVINLTKHIHIKSRGGDDVDTEEYGTYFPSFMWIVRDFTLQLVDQEGEPISSKDYLEKALEIQKGFSDNVEQKNRIRRLMKSFFKERDCCTMIRPLTNEENLQNLANMELDELRPEFIEQVMSLRRKVLNRVKPKMLNGKKLTGQMMATLAESYVESINNGVVPNIENAWSYICKNECHKAIEESMQRFEAFLRDTVIPKIPLDDDELKECYQDAKKEALELFSKRAVGNVADEYVKELKNKMQTLYNQIKDENEREAIHTSQMFLQETYSFIERRLKNKEFMSFLEYEKDIMSFQQYFLENGPPGPNRRMILLEFTQRAITEAADFFTKSILNELNLQQTIQQEQHKNLEMQLKELKTDHIREKDHFESKLRSAEVEKAELSAIEQSLRENLDRLQQEKLTIERELYEKADRQKKELQREIEEYKHKLQSQDSVASDLQRKVYQVESENEKEKALLEQKIEFLERTILDYQKKENEYSSELKREKKDHQQWAREVQSKYEQQIKALNVKLEETTEKLLELQSVHDDIESKYSYEKQKWEDSQASMKNNMTLSQSQYNDMQKTIDELKAKNRNDTEKLQFELQDLKEVSRQREEDLDQQLKDRDEEIKNMKNMFEKELAIFKQKIEFKDVQNQQLKAQVDESRKSHESMMKAVENRAKESLDGRETAFKQIEEIKEIHQQEVSELLHKFNETRNTLESQVDQLNEKYSELDLQYKLLQSEYEKETENFQQQLQDIDTQRQRALDQSKNTDTQKLKLLEETEIRYKQQIVQLERELDDLNLRSQDELRELQEKSEESLAQLKNTYEIDKVRLEHRLAEEKERAQKKISQLQEEFDQRLRDEQQQHEEDIEMLQEELRENERRNSNLINQLDHDNALMSQKIETLEAYLKEKEDRLSKEQNMTASHIEAQLERFNNERKELFSKIETLNQNITNKDRELTIIKNKLETSVEDAEKRKKVLDEYRQEFQVEKNKLNEKIEQLRTKNQEITDEFMQKKLEDGREIALYKQKLEFQQKKIEDLQRQYDEVSTKYDERIVQQKQEYQQDLQETIMRMNQQREQTEQKYEQKRKAFKEQETVYQRQITEIQKERAVLEEKLLNAEQKKDEIRFKYESEIEHLKEQLMLASEQVGKDRELFMNDNERLKQALIDLERDYSEIKSNYDKDKALWEGKCSFLEQQKEQAKADLQEAHKKFEQTMEQINKRNQMDKEQKESNNGNLIANLEQKFRQQMKDQLEQVQKQASEYNEKCKYLEKENRQLQSRLQLEQRDKMTDHGSMEKKVNELLENEAKLSKEIDELKQERDRRIVDHQRALEKDREVYKAKISEIEQKCKELENRRSTMIFEFEKERAKWGLEKDFISTQKQEVQEQLDRISRRNEQLLKENERLKSDKNRKGFLYGQGGATGTGVTGTSSSYAGKFNSNAFGQHLLRGAGQKENSGVAVSQAFPSGFAKFIGDGQRDNEKVDPTSLPLSTNVQNSMRGLLGSPSPATFMGSHQKQGSSGAASFKSGSNIGKNEFGGASSTDETLSQN